MVPLPESFFFVTTEEAQALSAPGMVVLKNRPLDGLEPGPFPLYWEGKCRPVTITKIVPVSEFRGAAIGEVTITLPQK